MSDSGQLFDDFTSLPADAAGTDEVGRGPLAGDVVAAAVILNPDNPIEGLKDSKKLSPTTRDALYEEILEKATATSIARASVAEIDRLNILQASLLAMSRSVDGLSTSPGFVFVDGNHLPKWAYPSRAVIQGDNLVPAIAAASILAKVTRDREMEELDTLYPGYGFAQHKGYPTSIHLQALQQLGPCEIHRRSYGPVAKAMK